MWILLFPILDDSMGDIPTLIQHESVCGVLAPGSASWGNGSVCSECSAVACVTDAYLSAAASDRYVTVCSSYQ